MALWGGRFEGEVDEAANRFHSSISFDRRLYREDIEGSLAHAAMLAGCKIISAEDGGKIREGLNGILADIEGGRLRFDDNAEDIHMFIEAELTARIGEAGKRLHTGRSRNDQVAVDTKMWTRAKAKETALSLKAVIKVLLDIAEANSDTIMPGYTHMQRAQPVTLAHHVLAYCEMFSRDISRLDGCVGRMGESPLGCGALAGTTYPIDRLQTARALGFADASHNSLDGVSDRDHIIEYIFCCSVIMAHLSRFCEEIILWNSREFGFVELSDGFATGSSMMPQKKNPDMAELIRGKTGRVYGDLMSLLTTVKGLPLTYDGDLQEDKEPLFDAADTVNACLGVFKDMMGSASFNAKNMRRACDEGFLNATDLADWLTKRGAAFRDAHEISGKLVKYCINENKTLSGLTLSELSAFSPLFTESSFDGFKKAIDIEECVNSRRVLGAPAKENTAGEIKRLRGLLSAMEG